MISVVGRAELLSSIFYLIGLLLITDKNLIINCNNKKKLISSLICSCIGFLCKEQCLMLLPLIVCFILIENVQMINKDEILNLKKSSSKLKLIAITRNHQINFRFLNQLKSLILNNHNHIKILRKRNKIIWFIIFCFTIILIFRLIAHGRSLTANFSALDQIKELDDKFIIDKLDHLDNKLNDNKLVNNSISYHYTANKINQIYQNNSLNVFLTFTYIIALNYWLLFYPYQLSCDWSFGSIKPIINFMDIKNLFTVSLIGLYLIPFLSFIILNYNQKQIKLRDLVSFFFVKFKLDYVKFYNKI